ncbi:uncharacterized protein EV420DRAFT_1476990 [Desarmillaria tabescens]|uniref:Uncharacterized protein n=1 Tax=Armillaria tabescens TaxID=1929756 RepID=A0AA39TPT8_ARMTA|nr:uncharacterized protein EV420DRAFT_1476990 [Desarmillaria tabescens]KAK0462238.1 hypothetical protein EV420DRAFT_1476990 [Desarmillaria tabescens]
MAHVLHDLPEEQKVRIVRGGAPRRFCGNLPLETHIDIWTLGQIYRPTKEYVLLGYCSMVFDGCELGVVCTWECVKSHVSDMSNKVLLDLSPVRQIELKKAGSDLYVRG